MSSYVCGACGTEVRGYSGCPTCRMIKAQESMANAAYDQNRNSQNGQTQYVYLSKSSVTAIKVISAIVLAGCFVPFTGGLHTSGFMGLVQLMSVVVGLGAFIQLIS